MESKEKKFWNWFQAHNSAYQNLDQVDMRIREKLLDQFLNALHNYCNDLFFQISNENGISDLIISAEGDTKHFKDVEKLVGDAPKIDKWKIIAFKPSIGINFVTNYEGIKVDPKKAWFLPLENEKNPKQLGLRISVENYSSNDEKKILSAVYQCLDSILGEKENALNIHYVEVDKIPSNPEEEGLIELSELPDYIIWRNKKVSE